MGGRVSHVDSFDFNRSCRNIIVKNSDETPQPPEGWERQSVGVAVQIQQYGQAGLPVSEFFPHMAEARGQVVRPPLDVLRQH